MSESATIRPGPEIDLEVIQAEVLIEAFDGTKFPALSYEDGVVAALRWVTGATAIPPVTEEEEG